MNEHILVVDDDYSILRMVETILTKHDYKSTCFENPLDALESFKQSSYDLIISDYFMPQMNGEEFLMKVRERDSYMPVIILTTNDSIDNAIALLKAGADDYISKPVAFEELIFRVNKNIKEKRNKHILDRINKEQEVLALESKRLVDWKELYAAKDTKQTDKVLGLFSRTLNQGGSFIWLDLLKTQLEEIDEQHYKINKRLVDLIVKSTDRYQGFFENITYLSGLDDMEVKAAPEIYDDFVFSLKKYVEKNLTEELELGNKRLIFQVSQHKISGKISIDFELFKRIMKELIINALKYSPENSDIFIMVEKDSQDREDCINIIIKNTPKYMNAKNSKGEPIFGIPYEYSEQVFDLFYTIDPYPTEYPGEEWQGGTGLFITRKLLGRMDGRIKTANGVDYSRGDPEPYVKFTITLPYK